MGAPPRPPALPLLPALPSNLRRQRIQGLPGQEGRVAVYGETGRDGRRRWRRAVARRSPRAARWPQGMRPPRHPFPAYLDRGQAFSAPPTDAVSLPEWRLAPRTDTAARPTTTGIRAPSTRVALNCRPASWSTPRA